ncbi:MAG: hypothetical protein WD066_03190 [Planctomycetaceae bacterium]
MALRIYADTSVIGGCFDDEFREESNRFFQLVDQGQVILLLSDLVVAELQHAPANVRSVIGSLPSNTLL